MDAHTAGSGGHLDPHAPPPRTEHQQQNPTGAPSSTTFREGVATTDRTSRAPYGTPHVSLLGATSIGWPNDGPALTIESSAGRRPTLPMTNRDGVSFHSDYIPHPRRPRRSAA